MEVMIRQQQSQGNGYYFHVVNGGDPCFKNDGPCINPLSPPVCDCMVWILSSQFAGLFSRDKRSFEAAPFLRQVDKGDLYSKKVAASCLALLFQVRSSSSSTCCIDPLMKSSSPFPRIPSIANIISSNEEHSQVPSMPHDAIWW